MRGAPLLAPLYLERSPADPWERLETPAADPYQEMAADFMEKARGRGTPLASARDAAFNLAVLDAARMSMETGGAAEVVTLPG